MAATRIAANYMLSAGQHVQFKLFNNGLLCTAVDRADSSNFPVFFWDLVA